MALSWQYNTCTATEVALPRRRHCNTDAACQWPGNAGVGAGRPLRRHWQCQCATLTRLPYHTPTSARMSVRRWRDADTYFGAPHGCQCHCQCQGHWHWHSLPVALARALTASGTGSLSLRPGGLPLAVPVRRKYTAADQLATSSLSLSSLELLHSLRALHRLRVPCCDYRLEASRN